MGGNGPDITGSTLAPEEAFGALGNGIRIDILRILGDAETSLPFSDLRTEVGVDDPGRFNYHLNQLSGHFVEQDDAGYRLKRPGERAIEAVLSGAVTETPVIERTQIDWACHFCHSTPIEMEYRDGQIGVYCTDCPGMYGGIDDIEADVPPSERNRLWYAWLPPAGIKGRSPEEVLYASARWTMAEIVTSTSGICPSCSAPLGDGVDVCINHDTADGLCSACDRRFAVLYWMGCTNCVFDSAISLGTALVANLELRSFMIEHGLDPVAPKSPDFRRMIHQFDEEVRSTDPLEARITYHVDDHSIALTVDESLNVVDVAR